MSESFGRYSLLNKIASGGMATLYRASSRENPILAIKQILPDFSQNEEFVRMFLQEAKISLQLKHPHIVHVFDLGQADNIYYLALEYIFGKDVGSILRTSLEKRVAIPIDIACHIILQAAEGLHAAHIQTDAHGLPMGIVHRDISPPNLLVSYNGEVKVIDFGIAKVRSFAEKAKTKSGVLKGKFAYMSPEQAEGNALNHQSDLFSLGIVFYELLTQKSLFFSSDDMETLKKVRDPRVSKISSIKKDFPAALDKILQKCLSKNLNDRYENASHLAADIHLFLDQHYPSSDTRSLASFMRSLFQDDYLRRIDEEKKSGFVDILVSGPQDERLLLETSRVSSIITSSKRLSQKETTQWQRWFYDPLIGPKIKFALIIIAVIAAVIALTI